MKKLLLILVLFFNLSCENDNRTLGWGYAEKKWLEAERIESEITGSKLIEINFNANNHNIIPDGKTMNTIAINTLIDSVSKKGGGIINFSKGTYLTGGIILKDNVGIHLEKEAVIKFSQNPVDYTPNVLGHWEGMEIYNFRAFIYSNSAKNISITGSGVLDGNAGWDNWWGWSS